MTLSQHIGFTPDDLEINRAGQLSDMQVYELRVARRRVVFVNILILLVIVGTTSLMIYTGRTILTLIAFGILICYPILSFQAVKYWLRLTEDIRSRHVQATTGKLERVIKPITRRVFNYMIRIQTTEVFVSKDLFDALEHQAVYTIYCAPNTGKLLSMERVES
ncbi:MAG: hypothetical protein CUN56_11335 [Phototrophicales bacterium]|nr:MAG: hypothetical protein CUN56_11335 [Phototrophicales bacterium]RMG74459.1 MAG: hypothetical protein D6711_08815 [Chloroflexota bacterium]